MAIERQYRVAVIGRTKRGNYGHGLDVCWQAVQGTKVVAVADDDPTGLTEAAKRLSVSATFADWRAMLDKVKPDIVAIASRWIDQHRDMAVAAAERGCHIYIEKPLCRTLAECDEIVAACERNKVKFAMAHPTRYSPLIATIKKLIADGKLGQVLEYRLRCKEDQRGGGEDLWVLGSHVIDMLRAVAGKPEWCYARVTMKGRRLTPADVVEGGEGIGKIAGDQIVAQYGMPDGTIAHLATRRDAGKPVTRYGLRIHGSLGIIDLIEGTVPDVKILLDASWSPGRSGKAWQKLTSAGIGQPEPLTDSKHTARHTLAILDLLDAIEHDRQPLCNVYEARGITEMIVACYESDRLGRPVRFPLENRQNPLTTT